jgi:hypothetical protein
MEPVAELESKLIFLNWNQILSSIYVQNWNFADFWKEKD